MPFQKGNQYGKNNLGKHYGGKKKIPVEFDENENGCWICTSHKVDAMGYVSIRTENNRHDKLHRIMYRKYKGEIPQGMCVCHSCDFPGCINPEHLFLGTHKENMEDKVNKNRQYRPPTGEYNHQSKLTEKDVLEIKESKKSKIKDLAQKYNVSAGHIGHIIKGRVWKHIK